MRMSGRFKFEVAGKNFIGPAHELFRFSNDKYKYKETKLRK